MRDLYEGSSVNLLHTNAKYVTIRTENVMRNWFQDKAMLHVYCAVCQILGTNHRKMRCEWLNLLMGAWCGRHICEWISGTATNKIHHTNTSVMMKENFVGKPWICSSGCLSSLWLVCRWMAVYILSEWLRFCDWDVWL